MARSVPHHHPRHCAALRWVLSRGHAFRKSVANRKKPNQAGGSQIWERNPKSMSWWNAGLRPKSRDVAASRVQKVTFERVGWDR